MTLVATLDTPKSIPDLEIVEMFARKTKSEGETPRVYHLWNNNYRINWFYTEKTETKIRSLFVRVSGGQVEIPE
jgi:hypothetical protein